MRSNYLGYLFFVLICASVGVSAVLPQWPWLPLVLAGAGMAAGGVWIVVNRVAVLAFLTKRSTKNGANLSLVVFLVFGIVVFVNVLGKQYNWRKDLTRSGTNSLSPQTVKVLQDLTQGVKVYYFNMGFEKEKKEPLFRNYQYHSKHLKYEFVDVSRRPTLVKSMEVKAADTAILVLEDTNKKVKVEGVSEEKLTNALIRLLRSRDQIVYFSTGHGERNTEGGDREPESYSRLHEELTKQGYGVKTLNLVAEGKVPADAAVLVVAGARGSFFPKELELIDAWLKAGGKTLFALDLDVKEKGLAKGSRQMAELLKPFGLTVHEQMLVDPTSKAANVEPQVLIGIAASRDHAITKDFPTSTMGLLPNFYFPQTTYLEHSQTNGVDATVLAKTSQLAWAEGDWNSLIAGSVSFQSGTDHKGEMALAYALEMKKPDDAKFLGRIVAFGASSFAVNEMLFAANNRDFFLNAVAWLASDEQFISIRPTEDSGGEQVNASANFMSLVFIVTVFLVPLLIVIAGIVVWYRRSKQ